MCLRYVGYKGTTATQMRQQYTCEVEMMQLLQEARADVYFTLDWRLLSRLVVHIRRKRCSDIDVCHVVLNL